MQHCFPISVSSVYLNTIISRGKLFEVKLNISWNRHFSNFVTFSIYFDLCQISPWKINNPSQLDFRGSNFLSFLKLHEIKTIRKTFPFKKLLTAQKQSFVQNWKYISELWHLPISNMAVVLLCFASKLKLIIFVYFEKLVNIQTYILTFSNVNCF